MPTRDEAGVACFRSCKRLLPRLQTLADFYQDAPLKMLTIDIWEDGDVAAADRRLHNTLRMFHSEALHVFYSSVSDLATATFIVTLVPGSTF